MQEDVLMELVDADSQALLDSLNPSLIDIEEPILQPKPAKTAFSFSPHEVRKASVTVSSFILPLLLYRL